MLKLKRLTVMKIEIKGLGLFILVSLLTVSPLLSQRDTISTNLKNINFDLGFGAYYQFTSFGQTNLNTAKIPALLPRRVNEPNLRNLWGLNNDLITDNPFFHACYSFRFGTQFQFRNALFVTAAISAEQRGFSDGVFSSNTRNFYPYLNAYYTKKIKDFSLLFQLGDFWDFKLYEGLTFSNLETQSWVFKFKYKNFYVKHAGIGDLLIGIGLGIDDLYDYSFGIEELSLSKNNQINLDVRIGYSNNRNSFGGGFWNFSTRWSLNEKYYFYNQLSIDKNSNSAFLFGLKSGLVEWNKFNLSLNAEFRSYDSGFNLGYRSNVYYRQTDRSASFINSTNNVFVPIDYYERNFNQWAVYTEFQDIDINGLNLSYNIRYNITKTIFIDHQLDFNWLFYQGDSFLYPFYKFAFGMSPLKSVDIQIELNNKVINLDKSYPTFYASNSPYFLIRVFKPLKYLKENDLQHRLGRF
jgi:hypothetical protein